MAMGRRSERMPLLLHRWTEEGDIPTLIQLEDLPDEENPKEWQQQRKMVNVAVIAIMSSKATPNPHHAIRVPNLPGLSSLLISMFTPCIEQMAADLGTTPPSITSATTNFVVMMSIGPLILAPLSETFGRRQLYLTCFSCFALLQVMTAFVPNVAFLIVARSISGFFSSVGIAVGGGTISDMFAPNERAGVYGWYLTGSLLGLALGPLFGDAVSQILGWRGAFCLMAIACCVTTWVGYFFLQETYAPTILNQMKTELEEEAAEFDGAKYGYEGEDIRPMGQKIIHALLRPLKIFSQPIVAAMSLYQALIFGTTYTIFSNIEDIFSETYDFEAEQAGMLYLGLGLSFLLTAWFLVPRIDQVYKVLTARNHGIAIPEYRLPLANIGALLIPVSLFCFAWAVETKIHWFPTIASTFLYGVGLVIILNCLHNYYMDSFGGYAASGIAAGTVFGSLIGGVISLFAPWLFDLLGYGWGISVFSLVSLMLAPAPLLLYCFGRSVRERSVVVKL